MQQQSGGTDCGAFSIAFAYYAAQGKDVFKLEVTQEDLGDHIILCHCFELTPLPLAYIHEGPEVREEHMWINTYCVWPPRVV